MLKPALAIFSMVASCKLPFGRPKRNFLLLIVAANCLKPGGVLPDECRMCFEENMLRPLNPERHLTPTLSPASRRRGRRIAVDYSTLQNVSMLSTEPVSNARHRHDLPSLAL